MHLSIKGVHSPTSTAFVTLPLFSAGLSAGLPEETSPQPLEYIDLPVSIVAHPEASFVCVVSGDSMIGAGINNGDHLLINASREPVNGDVVAATVNGEQLVKYFCCTPSAVMLLPANPSYPTLTITENDHFIVQGVVEWVFRQVRHRNAVLFPVGDEMATLPMVQCSNRGRTVPRFDQCIVNKAHADQLKSVLHELIDHEKCRRAVLVIRCAMELNLLLRPTYRQLKTEFPNVGSESSVSQAFSNNFFELSDKETIKSIIAEKLNLQP